MYKEKNGASFELDGKAVESFHELPDHVKEALDKDNNGVMDAVEEFERAHSSNAKGTIISPKVVISTKKSLKGTILEYLEAAAVIIGIAFVYFFLVRFFVKIFQ